MLLIECNNIKKYYGDRLILDVEDLKIYDGDRIGIVGVNGVGKTTLINLLSQRLDPDEGFIRLHGIYSYVSQLDSPEGMDIDGEMASKFNIPNRWNEDMSGGEKTRFKLAEAFIENNPILFADEPTSNLDMEGIELIGERLQEFKGALLLISHDRSLLDILCNKILEIEHETIKIYTGNYSDYYEQKRIEMERKEFEYSQYSKEKKRIKAMINDTRQKEQGIKRPPKRMGNSEARLHKMGGQRAKANLNRAIKNMEKRLDRLEVKEKPIEQDIIKLDIQDANRLYSKIVIEGKNVNKSFKDKLIFKNAEFNIFNGSKTALIGPNGCGKTTLIKMIMNRDIGINIAKGAKIGYFSQDMNILDDRLTIIENVMNTSVYDETFARILLARLLFKRESVYKEVGLLSGGERVKVSFAKLILQDNNLLVLDEPNNYLDIKSLEVVEETLEDYEGTLLFISHDRQFVNKIANQIMTIENYKIKIFNGGYEEYIDRKKKIKNKNEHEEEIFILENRLSEIIGRLSMVLKDEEKEILDIEYHSILQSLRELREI
ncbi:MAG: ribosomal protection-like ABC-F family protein [Tissierellaceae bacterium]